MNPFKSEGEGGQPIFSYLFFAKYFFPSIIVKTLSHMKETRARRTIGAKGNYFLQLKAITLFLVICHMSCHTSHVMSHIPQWVIHDVIDAPFRPQGS